MPTKKLILGTAQWGWTVSPQTAFQLLDRWYDAGFRAVDCATNYPINKIPADFRAAEKILWQYIQAHGISDLAITTKIGSLDNLKSPEINLSPSFLQMMGEEYLRLFGNNLDVLMVHWDNRDQIDTINATLDMLALLQNRFGLRPGLSGIKHPEIYRQANQHALIFDIQLKHNVLQSDIHRYHAAFPPEQHAYYAYGTSAGGIRLGTGAYSPESTFVQRGGNPAFFSQRLESVRNVLHHASLSTLEMWQVGLVFASFHPDIHGIVLGANAESQLLATLGFLDALSNGAFEELYRLLQGIPEE